MKNVLKGKHFAYVEEVKQKMAEALKGINIDKFKNCFEQWKKRGDGYIAPQMKSNFKATEVYTCRNKYTIFYKYSIWGFPLITCNLAVLAC